MDAAQALPRPPKSVDQPDSYHDMKSRLQEAQDLYNKARANGATKAEAARFARRQIEAARRARVQYEAELTNSGALPTSAEIRAALPGGNPDSRDGHGGRLAA